MTTEVLAGEFLLLNDAIWYFAAPGLKAEYERRAALPKPEPPRKKRGASDAITLWAHSAELSRHQNFVDEPWQEAKRNLFAMFFQGKLEAWGVMREPQKRIRHERIPPAIFDNPTMGWKQNVIKKHGYCYVSVVVKHSISKEETTNCSILNSDDSNQLPVPKEQDNLPPAEKPKKQRGPRTKFGLLPPIHEELEQRGSFVGKTKKQIYGDIRERAQELYPRQFPKGSNYPSFRTIDKSLDSNGIKF